MLVIGAVLAIAIGLPLAIFTSRSSTQASEALATVSEFTQSALRVAKAASLGATATWSDVLYTLTLPRCRFHSNHGAPDVWRPLVAPSMHGLVWPTATYIRVNLTAVGLAAQPLAATLPAIVRQTDDGRHIVVPLVLPPQTEGRVTQINNTNAGALVFWRFEERSCDEMLAASACKSVWEAAATSSEQLFFVLFQATPGPAPQDFSPSTTLLQAPLYCS